MPHFKTKSWGVEAEQYDGTPESIERLQRLVSPDRVRVATFPDGVKILLYRKEWRGDADSEIWQEVAVGHWLAKHGKGEIYITHPNHFAEGRDYIPV